MSNPLSVSMTVCECKTVCFAGELKLYLSHCFCELLQLFLQLNYYLLKKPVNLGEYIVWLLLLFLIEHTGTVLLWWPLCGLSMQCNACFLCFVYLFFLFSISWNAIPALAAAADSFKTLHRRRPVSCRQLPLTALNAAGVNSQSPSAFALPKTKAD